MKKSFVGLIASLTAMLVAVPANADNEDEQFVQYLQRNGISIDEDAAVDMAETACDAPLAGFGYSNALQAMQQQYPEFDINTVARVMSQGVLAYCPERLG